MERTTLESALIWVEGNKVIFVVIAVFLASVLVGSLKSVIITSLVFLFMSKHRRDVMGEFAEKHPLLTINIVVLAVILLFSILFWWVVPVWATFNICYLITKHKSWGVVGRDLINGFGFFWTHTPTSAKFIIVGIILFVLGALLKSSFGSLAILIGFIGIVLVGIPLLGFGKGVGDFAYKIVRPEPVEVTKARILADVEKRKQETEKVLAKINEARDKISHTKLQDELEYLKTIQVMIETGMMTPENANAAMKKHFANNNQGKKKESQH